ncbi:MAG: hypothetical protein WC560_11175 [Syntrophales bacterium]
MLNRNISNECFKCNYRKQLKFTANSACGKPDLDMTGLEAGVASGYFKYPNNFNPAFKAKLCSNFEEKAQPQR